MNVPKLRFKEFNDEWQSCKIGDFCKILMCKRIFANETSIDYEIPFYKIGTIGGVPDTYISRQLFEEYKSKYNYPKKEELLITCSGTVGKCIIFDGHDSYYQDSNIVWLDNPTLKVNNIFLYYLLSEVNWSKLNSTTIVRIYGDNLRQLEVNFPTKNEQIKISKTLQLLDKKIELQTKKIEALKLFKLGLRNELFREPQNIKIKLRNLVKCESSTITLKDIENDFGLYPIYGATGLIKNISKYNFENKYIAIIKDGAGVGRTILCNGKSSILATMNALIPKNEYPINYICEHINRIKFEKYIVGSGIPHIYFKDYGNEELSIHSLEEAYKIDLVFKNLDKKIELLYNKLNKLSELKKGLMQSMFV